jgi:hypothetical protein
MRKLLIGCAIAIGVCLVVTITGSVLLYTWFKRNAPDMERVETVRDQMRERFGERDDYVPPLDGVLPPDRVELFLKTREELGQTRQETAVRLDEFIQAAVREKASMEERSVFSKIKGGVAMARSGAALLREGVDYLGVRTEKLLASGMGEGEYVYLYSLMTYAWLGWDPIEAVGQDLVESLELTEEIDELGDEYRRIFIKQLRNQKRELERKRDRSDVEERTLKSVEAALDAADAGRNFPYAGAVPASWLAVLEPLRERYVATLPKTPAEVLLDSASLMTDDKGKGVQVNIE